MPHYSSGDLTTVMLEIEEQSLSSLVEFGSQDDQVSLLDLILSTN